MTIHHLYPLLLALMMIMLMSCTFEQQNHLGSIDTARYVVAQKTPSSTHYRYQDETLIIQTDKRVKTLPALPDRRLQRCQSGDDLLVFSMEPNNNLWITKPNGIRTVIELDSVSPIQTVDIENDTLFFASQEHNRLTFRRRDLNGKTLAQEELSLNMRTKARLFSLLQADHWVVWAPGAESLIVFDKNLALIDVRAVLPPEAVKDLNLGLIENLVALKEEGKEEDLAELCQANQGRTIVVKPVGFFANQNTLYFSYYQAVLEGCIDQNGIGGTWTSQISQLSPTAVTPHQIKSFKDWRVSGWHGTSDELLIASRQKKDDSSWQYQTQVLK